ncbi:sensor histidine kinase [Cohnella sp. LGH]|uniref:histidine kinase n=1 Tax=Cohnella phaseoli TaxID=456490 RepID=A0A3D9IUW4_9BACL|nr:MULTISPECIES: sensor histidine kinase [Cohnella]QTH40596.1 sensor histidine kinase [Cohnella sp. LGH]RED65309.1 two-component system sensor histidine kinase YesM [Cohnella phaseoli]
MRNAVIKGIVGAVNNIGLRKKLYTSLLVFIFIPLLVFGYYLYDKFSARLIDQFEYTAGQAFEQTAGYLEYKIFNVNSIANIVMMESKIQELFKYTPSDKYNESIIQDEYYRDNLNFLYSLERSKDIYRIGLYVPSELVFANERDHFFNWSSLAESGIVERMEENGGKLIWLPSGILDPGHGGQTNLISALCRIRNLGNYHQTLGACRIDLLESDVHDIIARARATPSSLVALVNENGQTITSVGDPQLLAAGLEQQEISDILQEPGEAQVSAKIKIENRHGVLLYKDVKGTDWKLLSFIPDEDMLRTTESVKKETAVFVLVLCVLAYGFAIFISSTITSRIKKLVVQLKQTERGDFKQPVVFRGGHDEIGQLGMKFNHMLGKISDLIEEKYNLGKSVKGAELKALQAQINPHFLYNTLECIRWMTKENKSEEINRLLYLLAKFYRLSLSKGEEVISLRDELEHIKAYVEIQNIRFDDSIQLEIDVPEELLELNLIKLVLQPIVENSILHGILEKENGTGRIQVKAECQGEELELSVTDDGPGIEEEVLKNILNSDKRSRNSGYGIKNVNERIKLYYGSEYGLEYRSVYGEGTTVRIRLPAHGAVL